MVEVCGRSPNGNSRGVSPYGLDGANCPNVVDGKSTVLNYVLDYT